MKLCAFACVFSVDSQIHTDFGLICENQCLSVFHLNIITNAAEKMLELINWRVYAKGATSLEKLHFLRQSVNGR